MSEPRSEPKNEAPFTRPIPDPPAAPSLNLRVAQAVIFLAGTPLDSLLAPTSYKRALSADRNHPEWCDQYTVDTLRHGQVAGVFSWCDCRPDGGTAADFAIERALRFGLDGWYGQAESAEQFDHALERGRALNKPPVALIGNLTALRDDQRELIRKGEVLFIFEQYRNVAAQRDADFDSYVRNTGPYAGLAGRCAAAYTSDGENATRIPMPEQTARGWFTPGVDSFYAPGCEASEDFPALKGA